MFFLQVILAASNVMGLAAIHRARKELDDKIYANMIVAFLLSDVLVQLFDQFLFWILHAAVFLFTGIFFALRYASLRRFFSTSVEMLLVLGFGALITAIWFRIRGDLLLHFAVHLIWKFCIYLFLHETASY